MRADEQFYYSCFSPGVIGFIKDYTVLTMKHKTRAGIKTVIFFFFNTETIACQGHPEFFKTVFLYSSSSEKAFHFQSLQMPVIPRKVQCAGALLSVVRLNKNWMRSNHMIHCNSAYQPFKTLGSQASKQG